MDRSIRRSRRCLVALGFGIAGATGIVPAQAQEMCGGATYPFPYTDVSAVGAAFCPGIMEAYVTGVSKGTSPTTFSPTETVTRVQMTTFLQRSLDQGLTRGSHRAGLNQWWIPQSNKVMQTIPIGATTGQCVGDGGAIWTTNNGGELIELQANTGMALGTWTGLAQSFGLLAAAGKIFVAGRTSPGVLYVIDPTQAPGPVSFVSNKLGDSPYGMAFDGTNLWTANIGAPGSVSIIDPTSYAVTTVSTGFSSPYGALYDGANIWVTDKLAGTLLKLDAAGAILQTVTVGAAPQFPAYDGANIWVPNFTDNSITVVQATTGNIVATIGADASNNLDGPSAASFDGERILITNFGNSSVTVFKAAELSLIANITTGASTFPTSVCSDGVNFFLELAGVGSLLRF